MENSINNRNNTLSSKDDNQDLAMHSKSENKQIRIHDKADEVAEESF